MPARQARRAHSAAKSQGTLPRQRQPEALMRRVVITGLGLVTPLGCGVDVTWSRLLNSQSGVRRVKEFDVTDIACQIAGFVPRGKGADGAFEPDDWMEPKDSRKVDEFIVYAVAA